MALDHNRCTHLHVRELFGSFAPHDVVENAFQCRRANALLVFFNLASGTGAMAEESQSDVRIQIIPPLVCRVVFPEKFKCGESLRQYGFGSREHSKIGGWFQIGPLGVD